MNKETKETIGGILVVLCFIAIVVTGILAVYNTQVAKCEGQSGRSGLSTTYEKGICWVELLPDFWVRDYEILRYIHLLKEYP